jgi:hypothetical protein
MNDDKLWAIVLDIYREAFCKAEPSADFDKLMKDGETKKEGWFYAYHLDDKKQCEIVDRHIKCHKLSKYDSSKVRMNTHLGCLPCSCEYKNHKRRLDED